MKRRGVVFGNGSNNESILDTRCRLDEGAAGVRERIICLVMG